MKCDKLESVYIDRTGDWVRSGNDTGEFYLKSEVDKVITLLTDKANYNEEGYKVKKQELADACRFYEDEIRHQKYKRCLYKAEMCKSRSDLLFEDVLSVRDVGLQPSDELTFKVSFFRKWHNRWLELAEKLKPNKEQ